VPGGNIPEIKTDQVEVTSHQVELTASICLEVLLAFQQPAFYFNIL
jgi:hypothetical protein